MSAASFWKYVYLTRLAKPIGDRRLFGLVRNRRPLRIAEIGIDSLERTCRVVEVAQRYAGADQVHYTGLDRFDARLEPQAALGLKQTHRALKATGAKVRLVPGDPPLALSATANQMLGLDLLLFSRQVDLEAFGRAWFYVPRMLHPETVVVQESTDDRGEPVWSELAQDLIEQRATAHSPREAA